MTSTPPASALRTPDESRSFGVPSVTPDLPSVPTQEGRPDSGADYRASHSGLLTSLFGPGRPALPPPGSDLAAYGPLLGAHHPITGRRLGGIVVPAGRSFALTEEGLLFAARIALAHGCPLVVVHSLDARAEDFPPSVRELLGDALVLVELAAVHETWLPAFESAEDELSALHRTNDVGWKRNLGLMLALRFGWEYVLFLDDDISPAAEGPTLTPQYLAHALRVLREDEDLQVVGWPLREFDDNSVVGHARPLVGLPQDIFISSGALLLRAGTGTAFFPHGVYNEDWLLILQTLAGARDYQRALAQGGSVRQKPYPAFCPDRARSEEAGEILGEGLMNLVEDHGPGFPSLMSGRYWKRVMAGRRSLLRRIIRLRAGDVVVWNEGEPQGSDDEVVECMNTALWTHQDLTARKLANYAGKWWRDRLHWQSVLVSLALEAAGREPEARIPELLAAPRAPWPHSGAVKACQDGPTPSASTTDRGWEVTV
jgi:hypothetical protein